MADEEVEAGSGGRPEITVVSGTGSLTWIVLVGICGFLLVGMLTPVINTATPKARRINCAGNLKQIGLALIIYAGDDVEEGYFPDGETFAKLNEQKYLVDGKVYGCSQRHKDGHEPRISAGDSDYVYLGEGLRDDDPRGKTLIIAHERLGNHQAWVNCLYADGHVKGHATTATTWHEFRQEREAAGEHFGNRPPWAGLPPEAQEIGQ